MIVTLARWKGLLPTILLGATLAVAGAASAQAETAPGIDAGDTAWILMASALVMLMTPGLALFYGGMVRAKNVLGTLMQVFFILGIVTVQFALVGYTLAFGPDIGGFIGGRDFAFLNGVSAYEPSDTYATTVPHQAFMVFQMMFAIITPALIVGAIAERIRFRAIAVFTVAWATLVYDPIAHWVWGGGWLAAFGGLDFAGGLVVHVSAGVAALACALYLGRRLGHGEKPMTPHNLTLTVLGAGLLWFGWFGFNAGSALAADGLAVTAFVTTQLATGSAVIAWAALDWLTKGKPTVLGAATGAVAGLVAITPAAGFVEPMAAIAIGLGAGALCFAAVAIKNRLAVDDSLDAFPVHGVGGAFGALAVGLFATTAVNGAGADGVFYGNAAQMIPQAVGLVAVVGYTFALTWVILWVTDKVVGFRVAPEDEHLGLDLSQHGEVAYDFSEHPTLMAAWQGEKERAPDVAVGTMATGIVLPKK